jgi:hypothetical protein
MSRHFQVGKNKEPPSHHISIIGRPSLTSRLPTYYTTDFLLPTLQTSHLLHSIPWGIFCPGCLSWIIPTMPGGSQFTIGSNWLFAVAVTQPWPCTVFHYVRLFLCCYVMYCFIGKVYKLIGICVSFLRSIQTFTTVIAYIQYRCICMLIRFMYIFECKDTTKQPISM